MEKFSLDALAREHLKHASTAAHGRSAETVYGGHEHTLRQTIIAITADTALPEHANPGEGPSSYSAAGFASPADRPPETGVPVTSLSYPKPDTA